MITKAHIAAWTIAALSGGALACETAPQEEPARELAPFTKVAPWVEYFHHNGNDCYVYWTHAIACVKASAP